MRGMSSVPSARRAQLAHVALPVLLLALCATPSVACARRGGASSDPAAETLAYPSAEEGAVEYSVLAPAGDVARGWRAARAGISLRGWAPQLVSERRHVGRFTTAGDSVRLYLRVAPRTIGGAEFAEVAVTGERLLADGSWRRIRVVDAQARLVNDTGRSISDALEREPR